MTAKIQQRIESERVLLKNVAYLNLLNALKSSLVVCIFRILRESSKCGASQFQNINYFLINLVLYKDCFCDKNINFANMIDHHTIDKIRDAADIYDVVKEFVTLKKAGANYKGLCPFHDEKTPSFVVSPAKGLFKCFSCGQSGNAIGFIMQHEQMTYPEALRWLAHRYGIHIEEHEISESDKQVASDREAMFAINQWACSYFEQTLHESVDGTAVGMTYFRGRGFRDDIIKKFQLGFCLPQREAMTSEAIRRGFNKEFLVKTGLSFQTEQGALYDRYHGRVIFPIHTVSGRVVAFGGRILGNDAKQQHVGKYVNSPESEIYNKSNELYGLFQAKHSITKKGKCYLVEGYTDVISMHQAGVENVVASSGTSLTTGQIRLIRRFTPNITVLYDGDSAGIKASLRGIDMLLNEGMNVMVLLLPDGEDPDSFARKHGSSEFESYIQANETDFISFKTKLLLDNASNDPHQRASAIKDIVESIAAIPDVIARQTYIHRCAMQVQMDERIIAAEVQRACAIRNREAGNLATTESNTLVPETQKAQPTILINDDAAAEQALMLLLVRHGGAILYSENTDETEACSVATYILADLSNDGLQLSTPLHNRILHEAANLNLSGTKPYETLHHFLQSSDVEIQQFAARVAEDDYELSSRQRDIHKPDEERLVELVPRIINEYKFHIIEKQLRHLLTQLKDPATLSNSEETARVMQEYMMFNQLKQELSPLVGERVVTI